MPLPILAQLLIVVALQVVGYALSPKPKTQKQEIQDMETPTADAGRPVPVVVGSEIIKSPNILWYGEKATETEDA